MKKQDYLAPNMEVIKEDSVSLLSGSGGGNGGSGDGTPIGDPTNEEGD